MPCEDKSKMADQWLYFRVSIQEQVKWMVEEGADYIIAETFSDLGEAEIALDVIKKHGNGEFVYYFLTLDKHAAI